MKQQKTLPPKQYLEVGSPEEHAYLDQLSNDIVEVNIHFVTHIKEMNASLEKKEQLESNVDMLNIVYQRQLMLKCVEPLTHGVNTDNVIQAVGMYAGICLVSPSFRKDCHSLVQNVMYPAIERKAERSGPNSIWAKRRDAILRDQNGGRLPLTPQSAALMEIGFMERAYGKMRVPNADIDAVINEYNEAVSLLHKCAEIDGITEEELNQSTRTIVGQMAERDPRYKNFVDELAFNNIERGEYYTVTATGPDGKTMVTKEVWQGEFFEKDGSAYTKGFSPRQPGTTDDMLREFNTYINQTFSSCKTADALLSTMSNKNYQQECDRYCTMMVDDTMGDTYAEFLNQWKEKHPDEAKKFDKMWTAKQAESTYATVSDKDVLSQSFDTKDDLKSNIMQTIQACNTADDLINVMSDKTHQQSVYMYCTMSVNDTMRDMYVDFLNQWKDTYPEEGMKMYNMCREEQQSTRQSHTGRGHEEFFDKFNHDNNDNHYGNEYLL